MDNTIIIAAVNLTLNQLKNEQLEEEGQTFINQEVIDLINLYLEGVLRLGQVKVLSEYKKMITEQIWASDKLYIYKL